MLSGNPFANMNSHVTLHPVIVDSQRRADGTYNVKIRLTFKRVPRIISTNITAYPDDVTLKKPRRLKANSNAMQRAQELCIQIYRAIDELNYTTLQLSTVDYILSFIQRKMQSGSDFQLDFFAFGEEFARTKDPDKNTGKTYLTALNAFKRFLGRDSMDISEINKALLLQFMDFLKNEERLYICDGRVLAVGTEKKVVAPYIYLRKLKAIYQAAKDRYNDEDEGIINIPKSPFANIDLSNVRPMNMTAKTVDFIQMLINEPANIPRTQRLALDFYILSFGLWGLNLIDFVFAKAPADGVLEVNRTKTKDRRIDRAYARIKIDPRLEPFLARVRSEDPNYFARFTRPADPSPLELRHVGNEATRRINRGLKSYAEARSIDTFTFYSARHSFATLARSSACGIDKATVDEMLIHRGSLDMADRYIEKDWKIYWEANKKLLDLFEWPEQ